MDGLITHELDRVVPLILERGGGLASCVAQSRSKLTIVGDVLHQLILELSYGDRDETFLRVGIEEGQAVERSPCDIIELKIAGNLNVPLDSDVAIVLSASRVQVKVGKIRSGRIIPLRACGQCLVIWGIREVIVGIRGAAPRKTPFMAFRDATEGSSPKARKPGVIRQICHILS